MICQRVTREFRPDIARFSRLPGERAELLDRLDLQKGIRWLFLVRLHYPCEAIYLAKTSEAWDWSKWIPMTAKVFVTALAQYVDRELAEVFLSQLPVWSFQPGNSYPGREVAEAVARVERALRRRSFREIDVLTRSYDWTHEYMEVGRGEREKPAARAGSGDGGVAGREGDLSGPGP